MERRVETRSLRERLSQLQEIRLTKRDRTSSYLVIRRICEAHEGLASFVLEELDDRAELDRLLLRGAEQAREISAPVMAEVRRVVGLSS